MSMSFISGRMSALAQDGISCTLTVTPAGGGNWLATLLVGTPSKNKLYSFMDRSPSTAIAMLGTTLPLRRKEMVP